MTNDHDDHQDKINNHPLIMALYHILWRPRKTTVALSTLRVFSSALLARKLSHHEPLRILFCGSDDFSCASLRALAQEKDSRPESIDSIDVLCRPGKRTGRSLKHIREGTKNPMHAACKQD